MPRLGLVLGSYDPGEVPQSGHNPVSGMTLEYQTMTDMTAFLAALTPEQRAALAAVPTPTPSPKAAKAKAKAAMGQAKPAPVPSDDEDDTETVPEAVAAVGVTHRATGPTIKATPKASGAMVGPDTHGRFLPVSVMPIRAVFHFADGSQQSMSLTPKVFSTGSLGAHGTGKVSIDSPDGRPLQGNLILTYVKPKDSK